MEDLERENAALRAACIDEIHEQRGEPVSQARQLQIRARAVRLARERLALTGAARAQSLQSEQRLLEAALRSYNGEDVSLTLTAERFERDGNTGLAEVVPMPTPSNTKAAATPTLTGYASVYNQWATICNSAEGYFREMVTPSAFTRSLASGEKILALFMHGKDPLLGQRPLGRLSMNSDARGLAYEVETIPHRSLDFVVEACRMNLCGSSFAFEVVRDQWRQPTMSMPDNVECIPERTLLDVRLRELGPCPLPAYSGTDVAVRSALGDDDEAPSATHTTPGDRASALRRIQLNDIDAERR